MANRIATCPQAKQITGTKSLGGIVGLASGPLSWKNTYTNTGTTGFTPSSHFDLAGAWSNSPPVFNTGDMVLVQHPFSNFSAPAYFIYLCVSGFTPAPLPDASRPPGYVGPLYWSPMNFASPEAIHWQQWNLCAGAQSGNGNFFVGLGGLPVGWGEANVNAARTVWGIFGALPPTSYLGLEYATVIAGSQAGGLSIDGTYAHNWSINRWTGALIDNGGTDGVNAPAAAAPYLFPAVPPNNTGATPDQIATNNPAPLLSISLAADGTSISFIFALMFDSAGNALWTVTQTATLTNSYTMADVQNDARTLLNGNQGSMAAMFDSMNWGQAATCVYQADGSTQVTLSRIANSVTSPTTCAAFPTAPGSGGLGSVNQDFFSNAYTFSAAQVDVCGQYCLRTFYCERSPAVVQCQNGAVDGYNPVTLPPPPFTATDGFVYSQVFPGSQC